jgi:amino acid permease
MIDFYGIFLVFCLLSVFWLSENMILNDLRFDFYEHFENQISNHIPIFQYDFKYHKIVPK